MTDLDKPTQPQTELEKLNAGLLIMGIKREMEEPEIQALEHQSYTHDAIQSQQTYAGEVIRIIKELKLTNKLLNEVKISLSEQEDNPSEELVSYYSGIFFDLVHQLKDKLFQLVSVMIIDLDTPLQTRYIDLSGDKINKFIKQNSEMLQKIGIYTELESWKKEDGAIGVTLQRRTQHHHKKSRLTLDKDYQQVKMARLMLSEQNHSRLSEYGQKRMLQVFEQSSENHKKTAVEKQLITIKSIEDNIEKVAKKLITQYKVPTSTDEIAKIVNGYSNHLKKFEITNKSSKALITKELKEQIDKQINTFTKKVANQIVSIYLVGSIGRNEFIPGSSDINVIVVTKNFTKIINTYKPVHMAIISENDFLTENFKIYRFECWADGIKLRGKEYKFSSKDFPKPGAYLTWLLNSDINETLNELKSEHSKLEKPTSGEMRMLSVKLARVMIHYAFGVAMGNNPFYSSSMRAQLEYAKNDFPNDKLLSLMEAIYFNGITIDANSYSLVIDNCIKSISKSFIKLQSINSELNS